MAHFADHYKSGNSNELLEFSSQTQQHTPRGQADLSSPADIHTRHHMLSDNYRAGVYDRPLIGSPRGTVTSTDYARDRSNATADAESGPPDNVLMLIRFDGQNSQTLYNSLVRQKGVIARSYGGRTIGFCPEVVRKHDAIGLADYMRGCHVDQDHHHHYKQRRIGYALFTFPSIAKARLCMDWTPELRQHDWGNNSNLDVLMLPMRTSVDPTLRCLEVTEWSRFKDVKMFESTYLDKLRAASLENNSIPMKNLVAVPNYAIESLRGRWKPDYLIISAWRSASDVAKFPLIPGSEQKEDDSQVRQFFDSVAAANVDLGSLE